MLIDDRSDDGGWEVLGGWPASIRTCARIASAATSGRTRRSPPGWPRLAVTGRWSWTAISRRRPRTSRGCGRPRGGHDLVRTVRRGWRHSAFRRWTSRTYRRLTLETDVRPDYSNLSLLSRPVIDAFLRLRDRDREYMIALDWLGFDSTAIEIEHHERHAGRSGYTLERLIRVALDGMFFRSTLLLRLVVLLGFVVALAGIVVAGFEVVDYFLEPDKTVPGYTSLAVLLLVLAGFIIVSVGVVGLYVGRIFEQVKDRPLFLIDRQAESALPAPPRRGQHIHLLPASRNQ